MQASKFIGPGLLIAIKTIAMPLITEEIVSQLNVGANQTETSDLSDFGKYLTWFFCKDLIEASSQFHIGSNFIVYLVLSLKCDISRPILRASWNTAKLLILILSSF